MTLNRRIVLEDSDICSPPAVVVIPPEIPDEQVAPVRLALKTLARVQGELSTASVNEFLNIVKIGLRPGLVCCKCKSAAGFETDFIDRIFTCRGCLRTISFEQFQRENG